MTARRTWPCSEAQHEARAAEVLRRHATRAGWIPALPVPVEQIIEGTFGLTVL